MGQDRGRAFETRALVGGGEGELQKRSQNASEVVPELAERGLVGEHDETRLDVKDGSGFRERGHDDLGARDAACDLILSDGFDAASAELLGDDVGEVLVDSAKRVSTPVVSPEREPWGLHPADPRDGREARGEGLQIEDLDPNRRRP